MNFFIILGQYFRSLILNFFKHFYPFFILSRGQFGKDFRVDFPLDVRGKGVFSFSDNCRLGQNSFINLSGRFKIGKNSHLHQNSIFIVESGAETLIGENFQLEPNCIIRNQQSCWLIGDNISISSNCQLFSREKGVEGKLHIGSNSNISNNSILDLSGDIIIGQDVAIANNCFLFTHNHNYTNRDLPSWKGGISIKPVIIEDGCWIGANSKILPGVTIGHRSVVAAGSVVTKNVQPNTIVGGNPAKILKTI